MDFDSLARISIFFHIQIHNASTIKSFKIIIKKGTLQCSKRIKGVKLEFIVD